MEPSSTCTDAPAGCIPVLLRHTTTSGPSSSQAPLRASILGSTPALNVSTTQGSNALQPLNCAGQLEVVKASMLTLAQHSNAHTPAGAGSNTSGGSVATVAPVLMQGDDGARGSTRVAAPDQGLPAHMTHASHGSVSNHANSYNSTPTTLPTPADDAHTTITLPALPPLSLTGPQSPHASPTTEAILDTKPSIATLISQTETSTAIQTSPASPPSNHLQLNATTSDTLNHLQTQLSSKTHDHDPMAHKVNPARLPSITTPAPGLPSPTAPITATWSTFSPLAPKSSLSPKVNILTATSITPPIITTATAVRASSPPPAHLNPTPSGRPSPVPVIPTTANLPPPPPVTQDTLPIPPPPPQPPTTTSVPPPPQPPPPQPPPAAASTSSTVIQAVPVSRAPRSLRFIRDSSSADFDLPSMKIEPEPTPASLGMPTAAQDNAPWLQPSPALPHTTTDAHADITHPQRPACPSARPSARVPVPQVFVPTRGPAVTWNIQTSMLISHTEGPQPVLKPPAVSHMDLTAYSTTAWFSTHRMSSNGKSDSMRVPAVQEADGPAGDGPQRRQRTAALGRDWADADGVSTVRKRAARPRKRTVAWGDADGPSPLGVSTDLPATVAGRPVKPPGAPRAPPPPPLQVADALSPLVATPAPDTEQDGGWRESQGAEEEDDGDVILDHTGRHRKGDRKAGRSSPSPGDSDGQGSEGEEGPDGTLSPNGTSLSAKRRRRVPKELCTASDAAAGGVSWGDDPGARPLGSPHPAIRHVSLAQSPPVPPVSQQPRQQRRRRPSQKCRDSPEAEPQQHLVSPQARGQGVAGTSTVPLLSPSGAERGRSTRAAGNPGLSRSASRSLPLPSAAVKAAAVAASGAAAAAAAALACARKKPRPAPKRATSPCMRFIPPDVLPATPLQGAAGTWPAPPPKPLPPSTQPSLTLPLSLQPHISDPLPRYSPTSDAPLPPQTSSQSPTHALSHPPIQPPECRPCASIDPPAPTAADAGPAETSTAPASPPPPQPPAASSITIAFPDPSAVSTQPNALTSPTCQTTQASHPTSQPGAPTAPKGQDQAPMPTPTPTPQPPVAIPCMHPHGVPAPAWLRGAGGPMAAVAMACESEWAAAQDRPHMVVCTSLPDLMPGDVVCSMLAWLRGLSMDLREQDLDLGVFHTYQDRYLAPLRRARGLEQSVGQLSPEDPLARPENLPGPRPPTGEERRALKAALQEVCGPKGEHGYRPRFQPIAPAYTTNKVPVHRLMVGARYQADIPPCITPLPPPQPPPAPASDEGLPRASSVPVPPPPAPPPPSAHDISARRTSSGPPPPPPPQPPPKPPRQLTDAEAALLGLPVTSPTLLADRDVAVAAAAVTATRTGSGRQRITSRRAASAAALVVEKKRKIVKVVYPPHQDLCVSVAKQLAVADSLAARHRVMDSTVKGMDDDMQDLVQPLGLIALGSKIQSGWTGADEAAFAAGLREHDREFALVQKHFLPHKTIAQIVSYYYNIWKIRYTSDSVAWHHERHQLKAMSRANGIVHDSSGGGDDDGDGDEPMRAPMTLTGRARKS